MKNIKCLLAVLLMMLSIAVSAQSTVTNSVRRYLIANGQVASMSSTMSAALVQVTSLMQIKVPSGYTTETLVNKYLEERFPTDMSAAIEPYVVEQGVTAAEINELSDLLETPEGKIATEHSALMSGEKAMAGMMAIVSKDAQAIVSGNTPSKVTTTASAERKRLFSAYYRSSGVDKLIPGILRAQGSSLPQSIVSKLDSYFQENLETLMLNSAEGVMTDDDLRFYNKLCAKPQYTKMIDGVAKLVGNPQQAGMKIMMNYKTWAESL